MTLHPQGKAGVNISKKKYDLIRGAIIESLGELEEQTFTQLSETVRERIGDDFEGSTMWYFTTVKLDMEARGEIERFGSGSPQRIRLAS